MCSCERRGHFEGSERHVQSTEVGSMAVSHEQGLELMAG